MLRQKPATKLYNAWLAGVPALLAPEPEYQRMRTSPEDFIEIDSLDSVLTAVRQLQAEPARYAALRARCCERSSEFSAQAIAARWLDVLTGPVTDQYDAWLASGGAQRPWLGHARKIWQQKREKAAFKAQIAEELLQLNAPPPLRSKAPELSHLAKLFFNQAKPPEQPAADSPKYRPPPAKPVEAADKPSPGDASRQLPTCQTGTQ